MENKQKFIELIADCLECEPSDITMETKLDELEDLDSLATLSMSASIKLEYDINICGADIKELKTISEIFNLVSNND